MTTADAAPTRPPAAGGDAPRWVAFTLVCLAYLATTTGEALLSPIYPVVAQDLGLDLAGAGAAFGVLAFSIAVFNVVGGLLLRRLAANQVLAIALATTSVGGVVAATADGGLQFGAAQVLLGAGAGLLYPGAVMSVGTFSGVRRRGFAMGVFGVFFSGGLTLAAALSAVGAQVDWRWSFGVASVLAAAAAVALLLVRDAPRSETEGRVFAGLGAVLGVPTLVGVAGGISQYATVSFLPVFAVDVWELSDAAAAGILAAGRVLSVPAKLVSGSAADRAGPIRAARATGVILAVSGLVWALAPWTPLAALAAIVFTAEVSALFPLANVLAFQRVGRQGPALGAFRSLQLGAGAAAGFLIGAVASQAGLRPTVAVVGALPLVLLAVGRAGATDDR